MAKKAVLCGINNYKSQTDLRGCVNDVENMSQLLTEQFGFSSAQIHKLFDDQVIKSAVQNEWNWLLENAKSNDHLVFHFSGHGSFVPDDGDDEADSLDEITCLYDMDFHNPETFLRDDEWNAMLQQVPQGVQLTIVMDNCHSGTGTRSIEVNLHGRHRTMAIDVETSAQRSPDVTARSLTSESVGNSFRSLLFQPRNASTATLASIDQEEYKQLSADETIVLPRFLVPPPSLQARVGTRTLESKIKSTLLKNQLLLTACLDSQTAADAYIEGNFHGAFTYYLCKTLRNSPQIDSEQLIQTVDQMLQTNQFPQRPQHEGDNRTQPIFGAPESPVIDTPPLLPSPIVKGIDAENQRLLIQAYLKLLDTISGSTAARESTLRQTADRHIVYVHGISQHRQGYSDSWWGALKQHVEQIFGSAALKSTRWEVLWSDLVNARASLREVDRGQEDQLRREIEAVLEERQRQEVLAETGGGQAARRAVAMQSRDVERGGGFALDDFLVYMTNSSMRQQIIDRFTEVVRPLLANGNQIDIISHSWGTVVAYEGLRELDQERLSGRVSNLFTVGSALSIGPVRLSLRSANRDGRSPALVDRWINIDAKGDSVGGMLGDRFDVTQEYLDQDPIGCTRSLFGYGLVCAHSSYFKPENLLVNRDIFGKYLNS